MTFNEFDHLWDCLSGQNRQQIGNQHVLVGLISSLGVGLKAAESDSFTIVGCSSASVNKWRVESVHIKVNIVNEKAFTNSSVTVVVSINVKPIAGLVQMNLT